jgi:hypothetical protein
MASLFQGSPQTATSYATSTTETPKWMQDAIYNQIQWAQNVANTPYQPYSFPTVAELSPLQQQAYEKVQKDQAFWQPNMDFSTEGMKRYSTLGTADQLREEQAKYLRQEMVDKNLNAGQNYFQQAGATTADALAERALAAANPYLQAASKTAAENVGQYMNPYQSGVLDVIAKQGARNLNEQILPRVSDAFIRAGQFGSGRMGEFGSRAVRDTQEAVLDKQAALANQGYQQSLTAAQNDLARQAQLAGTVGSISGADLSRILQGGSQYGNLGQMQTQAGQQQQQFGLTSASQAQQAQADDYRRQMAALSEVANLTKMQQAMRYADTAALESAGLGQQNQAQRQLDAAKAQYDAEQLYPRQQLDWLNTQIRGMAPITPQTTTENKTTQGATYSASPLSQMASGLALYKGLSNITG